jgi:integrase
MATDHGLVARNVADAVKPPRDPRKEQPTWTAQEVQRFLDVARISSYGPIWLLSLATGMRKGELLGLRWCDVDWDHDTVHVRQTQGVVRGKIYLKPTPKTAAGKRTITVPHSVMDQLKAHRVTQLAAGHWSKTGLVFTSATGTAINPRNLSRQCDVLMAKAGVPRISVHCQRHTHITHLLMNGVSVKAISDRVGHANASITLDTYSHLTREARREVADVVDRLLFG